MKTTVTVLVLVLSCISCGGGGGGGSSAPAPDLGTEPEITLGFLIQAGDKTLTPITSAVLGSQVQLMACVTDPDLDVEALHMTTYLLPDTNNPTSTNVFTLTTQEEAGYCYVTNPLLVIGAAGEYVVILEVDDAKGNTSEQYAINNLAKVAA